MEGKRVRRPETARSRKQADAAWVAAVTEEVLMEGNQVYRTGTAVRPRKKRNSNKGGAKTAWAVATAAALLVAGSTVGLGLYANGYDRVFPGVTVGDSDLSGLPYDELDENLPMEQMLSGTVTVTANGQELGTYTQAQLGATVETDELYSQVWDVGREPGVMGWLRNSLTMLKGRTGTKTTLEPTISEYNASSVQSVVQELAAKFDQDPVDGSYELNSDGLFATKPADGQALDQEGLAKALLDLKGGCGEVEAPWNSVPAQQLDMTAMQQDLRAEATPARYDTSLGKVVEGEVGISLDAEAAVFVLEAAMPGETVQLPAETIYPDLTAQDLQAVLFRDVLSTTTTNVGGTSARKGNVKLAGQAINGTVLNDGDIFDYNKVVGKRTKERGFGEAATYVNGETVNTVGGGICQVSSTLYLATLLANLETVERYNHRYYPGYIEKGMDATVSWGGPEYRFRNNTGYPIRIDVSYANSQLTVTIVGTKTDDTYVKMTNEVLSTTNYKTEYVETKDLAPGVQKQKQSGYVGYEVVTYRNIYDGNGNLISSKQEAKSSYKSRNRIILVGAGSSDSQSTNISKTSSSAPASSDSGITPAPAAESPSSAVPEPVLPPETGISG